MTSIPHLSGEQGRPDSKDEQMEQIRELLVGDIIRSSESRIETLEARLKEVEAEIGRRLDELAARIEALGADLTTERRSAFEELSRGVVELGERIRNLSRDES